MAKNEAKTATATAVQNKPRFEIRTPNIGFSGERSGVKFTAGTGWTDDVASASGLAGLGYTVKDEEAGSVSKGSGEEKE